jgi:hypothetical protein
MFGPGHDFGHFLGEPIRVSGRWIARPSEGMEGRLMEFPHHSPRRDVPQTVMEPLVPLPQYLVRGHPNVRQVHGIVVLDQLVVGCRGLVVSAADGMKHHPVIDCLCAAIASLLYVGRGQ